MTLKRLRTQMAGYMNLGMVDDALYTAVEILESPGLDALHFDLAVKNLGYYLPRAICLDPVMVDILTTAHASLPASEQTRGREILFCYFEMLNATDIAARGIDIDQLPRVVNFDLPNVPQDYVHRIGRTGRAGSSGQAISLVSGEEAGYLRDIERLIRKSIRCQSLDGFEPHSRGGTPRARAAQRRP